MAVVKAPALSLVASGNIGGVCYSRWRGLAVARAAWSGGKTPTILQEESQDRFNTVKKAWSGTLTESERQAWREAAQSEVWFSAIGGKFIPAGFNLFVKLNFQRSRRGLPLMTLPPIAMEPNGIDTFTVAWSAGGAGVALNAYTIKEPPDMDFYWESWRAGPYDNGGRHALPGEYRFVQYYDSWGFKLVLGLTKFKYYWFKARWNDASGRVGNWFEGQVYVES